MVRATLIKEIGADLQLQRLVQYGRKHGSTEADMVLEKGLRVLHLDLRE